MSKPKKLHSNNKFFFIVLYSVLGLFFVIIFLSVFLIFVKNIRNKKVFYKKSIPFLSDNSSSLRAGSSFLKDSIEKKKINQIMIGDNFTDAYFDVIFAENFSVDLMNNVSEGKEKKEKKSKQKKNISKKPSKNFFIEKKEIKSVSGKNKKTKPPIEKNIEKKVQKIQVTKKSDKLFPRLSEQKNNPVIDQKSNISTTVISQVYSFPEDVLSGSYERVGVGEQLSYSYDLSIENNELAAYTDRIVKHIKQFPGKKTKLELIVKTKRGKIVAISFVPEPRSIAYRNYLMQLLESTEVPAVLRDNEIYIFL